MIELRTINFEQNHIGNYSWLSNLSCVRLSFCCYLGLPLSHTGGDFPQVWCRLSNLTDLNLTQNNLRGTFPDAMGNLIHLKSLKLGANQFHGGVASLSYVCFNCSFFLCLFINPSIHTLFRSTSYNYVQIDSVDPTGASSKSIAWYTGNVRVSLVKTPVHAHN
jgi:hypothetical protein